MHNLSKLDNPVWHSLNEAHQRFAVGDEELKFYLPNIAPFGGINSKDKQGKGKSLNGKHAS